MHAPQYSVGQQVEVRFCKHFSESCTGCWPSTAAALLPKLSKGNSKKFVYKTCYSKCRPTVYSAQGNALLPDDTSGQLSRGP